MIRLISKILVMIGSFVDPAVSFSGPGNSLVCNPGGQVNYCPPYDVALMTMVSFEQWMCLRAIDESPSETLKAEVQKCFSQPRLKDYFNQLKIMRVSRSCLEQKRNDCSKTGADGTCQPFPCGFLGRFLKDVGEVGLETHFSEEDGIRACDSLAK